MNKGLIFPHLFTSWQESMDFLGFSNFVFDVLRHVAPCCQTQIYSLAVDKECLRHFKSRSKTFYKTLQNFYNERLYLAAPCQILKRVLQRLQINEEMNNWRPSNSVQHIFPFCSFYLKTETVSISVKTDCDCTTSAYLFQRSLSALLSWSTHLCSVAWTSSSPKLRG